MDRGARARGPLLVVDDDEDFRRSLAEALELEGWRVAEASNGAQALEWLARGERPAAVLLDLWMPTMDGWQFRRALAERSYGDLAIVVMTAARTPEAEALQVTDVIEKPFTLPQLLAVLERHVA
jgi:two-component system response regulator MprA